MALSTMDKKREIKGMDRADEEEDEEDLYLLREDLFWLDELEIEIEA